MKKAKKKIKKLNKKEMKKIKGGASGEALNNQYILPGYFSKYVRNGLK